MRSRLTALPIRQVAMSCVSEAELLFGLARPGRPPALSERVRQVLLGVEVLDWGREAGRAWADLRADLERRGLSLAPLDLMIAAHALAADRILVTRDRAFGRVGAPLRVEEWGAEG